MKSQKTPGKTLTVHFAGVRLLRAAIPPQRPLFRGQRTVTLDKLDFFIYLITAREKTARKPAVETTVYSRQAIQTIQHLSRMVPSARAAHVLKHFRF